MGFNKFIPKINIRMHFRKSILFAFIAIGMMGCKPAASNTTDAADSTGKALIGQDALPLLPASLICKEVRGPNEDAPLSIVSIKIGDQITVIDSISACDQIVPGENGVPKDALSACGGWWAGAGDYLYIAAEGNDAVVMAGWQDESQEDEGYHFKELKRFSRVQH